MKEDTCVGYSRCSEAVAAEILRALQQKEVDDVAEPLIRSAEETGGSNAPLQ
jgi:hypothetical protein